MLDRVARTLFLSVVIEILVGGGGRLTAIGPISLRMIFFAAALVITLIQVVNGKTISLEYWRMELFFLVIILIGICVAWLSENPVKSVFEDVKPLSYFLALPFFALSIEGIETERVSRLVRQCAVAIAIVFLIILALLNTGIIPFHTFYNATLSTQEFFYRGELSFFYKGFLFLGVGSIFFAFSDKKAKYAFFTLLILAITASVTRGLLFSLALTYAAYFFRNKPIYYTVASVLFAILIAVAGNSFTFKVSEWIDSKNNADTSALPNSSLFGDRNYSDAGRFQQMHEVKDRITFPSFIFGHGFGQGIPSRPVHMEISYLEIFHKQGIIGLSFWVFLFLTITKKYKKAEPSPTADAYFYSSLFTFIQSLTNQYINNPIGIAMLLLSLVSLDKLKKQ